MAMVSKADVDKLKESASAPETIDPLAFLNGAIALLDDFSKTATAADVSDPGNESFAAFNEVVSILQRTRFKGLEEQAWPALAETFLYRWWEAFGRIQLRDKKHVYRAGIAVLVIPIRSDGAA